MKKRLVYKNALKKHTSEEVLNMYRDNKLELNQKEWEDLHKRINKKYHMVHGVKMITLIHVTVCFLIICIVALNFKSTNFETIKKCNEIQGHTCSRYEIQRMISYGDNNR